ncbi:MAG: hypothetical protein KJ970_15675 [Candidatus Eisenbacteria bacterium]|uniref:Uncharacterized protein n=1 Tax=Eiseniibacteriota bacterium TaxID=2212470 RepID=A0A948W4L7_UNCEI|nr:hypothetical protein [Candidatus Eisenbacteria bacterium]MBU1948093.1 hypothetical protein [Candidatus Eisenbacteria bacterium]MBU2692362.1 hypothetical protein [Candidatus Eisenbacteria bacterium]
MYQHFCRIRVNIPVYAPVPIRLQVSIQKIKRWWGGDSFADATVLHPVPGQDIEGLLYEESGIACWLQLPGETLIHEDSLPSRRREGGPITCLIETGRVSDCYLALKNSEGLDIIPGDFCMYGENPLMIPNLLPGIYYLRVMPLHRRQTWRGQWYKGADSIEKATPIRVGRSDEPVRIVIDLSKGTLVCKPPTGPGI